MSKELAAAAKTRGNEAFSKGDFDRAITEFSEAIKNDPNDHIFYSNRSGAYASLKQYDNALQDADKCIQLKPDFIKGYSRKGVALAGMRKYKEAEEIYKNGLKLDANNQALKEGLEETQKAAAEAAAPPNPFGQMFGPQMWTKLTADPTTRQYLSDPEYVRKLNDLQRDPKLIQQYLTDPKISASLGVLLGIGSQGFNAREADEENQNFKPKSSNHTTSTGATVEDEDEEMPEGFTQPKPQPTQHKPSTASSSSKPSAPVKKELSPADQAKEAGNAAYLKKNFAEAMEHYNKAIELEPNNIVFYNNLAACYAEQKDYDKAIQTCQKAIEIGREHSANFKDIAKAYFRIGNCYAAQDKLDEAIEAYSKSQVEDYQDKTKQALKKIEQIKKEREQKAYINPELSEQHKQKGNEFFQNGKYAEAIQEYSEALKRDPNNYKVYSNRAACYTKLMDWQRGLEDAEKCLQFDPKFVKAYIRKAKIQHFLKQYHKALETYNKGLEIDPTASELIDGKRQTMLAINSGEADPERAKEAMKDPEIQAILKDPTINKVLADLQSNPSAGQAALANADIRGKIEKLIAAGVLQVK